MYVIDQPQALTCLSAAVDANEYPALSGLTAVLTSAAYFFRRSEDACSRHPVLSAGRPCQRLK